MTFTGKIVRISVSTTTASEELKKLISVTEKPVSYTHLDVYKRQHYAFIHELILFHCGKGVSISATNIIDTVSYTHLDVYKRQPYLYARMSGKTGRG